MARTAHNERDWVESHIPLVERSHVPSDCGQSGEHFCGATIGQSELPLESPNKLWT